ISPGSHPDAHQARVERGASRREAKISTKRHERGIDLLNSQSESVDTPTSRRSAKLRRGLLPLQYVISWENRCFLDKLT
ncbi:hypothetical protein, partial [Phormidium sp. CCY1219]|uniref:hypothetical protein n=1 Tax=Phormidium sp. CCY1219 TaxID=2886104 RepID=UPI002D1F7D01